MQSLTPSFVNFSGSVWRILWANQPDQALKAARAPEGRFHHDGQTALYASLSPQGAGVALNYYLRADDDPRTMTELHLQSDRIIDATDPEIAQLIGFEISDTIVRWQNDRKVSLIPKTWKVSDTLRGIDADGMIFRSNQRPNLQNIVLFHWNTNDTTSIIVKNEPVPWTPLHSKRLSI